MGSRSQEQCALLTDFDTTTAYSQAFYTLFANIRFHWKRGQEEWEQGPQVHTLLITSASTHKDQPGVAANLAIVAAQSGAETILVDADIHASTLQQRFGLTHASGLSDLLEEKVITPEKVVAHLQPTFVPGLRVLGAGIISTQSTALFMSRHLEQVAASICEILARSDKESGVAIYHSAPVLSGADASLLSALTEQTVLTVIMGQTTRAQARQAQEQLEQARAKLAGVIVLHA